ncbi:MAG: cobalt-precorrin 5A hydrolase [Lachnospiraceae bacterium]|jgi:cobalt-precorrin 5A hydrolase
MNIAVISFSPSGYHTGEVVHQKLSEAGYEVHTYTKSKYTRKVLDESQLDEEQNSIRNVKQFAKPVDTSLRTWASDQFQRADALIIIGSCGIAVRSIAPFIKDKKLDPAVVVLDEQGKYAIPLLSGHIGGANELANELAGMIDAMPIVTSAVDLQEKFTVDAFSKKNGFFVSDMVFAKEISAAVLAGDEVGFYSEYPWIGNVTEGLKLWDETDEQKPELGIYIGHSYMKHPFVHTLYLIPRVVVMGIDCRPGTEKDRIEQAIHSVCDEELIPSVAMANVVSIHERREERGIREYCEERNIPFTTYSAEELNEVKGSFSVVECEQSVAGVDNICERSALLGSNFGRILRRKYEKDGITIALTLKKWNVEFE